MLVEVIPKTRPNLPERRIVLVNPVTGEEVIRAKQYSGEKRWVFNTNTGLFNLVGPQNNLRIIKPNSRINNWWIDNLKENIVNRVFPKMAQGVVMSNLRPSLIGLKANYSTKIYDRVFKDIIYNFIKKPFPKGVTKVKVFGGRFETMANIQTKEQQVMFKMDALNKGNPSRLDITMDKYNIQIFKSNIIMLGGYSENINVNVNKINGRKILGNAIDVLEMFIKRVIPSEYHPIDDYIITNLGMDFTVNQKIKDPLYAVATGRQLVGLIKDYIKRDQYVPDYMIDYIPSFYYDYGEMNNNVRNILNEKIPDNIYLTYKDGQKRKGGSYISWKKGYVRIQGADSLIKVLLIVRTINMWYQTMKRDRPDILEEIDQQTVKKKVTRKMALKKENIEKFSNIKLELYGKDNDKVKINGKRCNDVSKTGFTSKELKAIGASKLIKNADKLTRSKLCEKLLEIAKKEKSMKAKNVLRKGMRRWKKRENNLMREMERNLEMEMIPKPPPMPQNWKPGNYIPMPTNWNKGNYLKNPSK